jgi:hypothetical protein
METRKLDRSQLLKWVRKIGFWGFLFFLAKGLIWIVIGYVIVN